MEIPIRKLLGKMEEEIKQAKNSSNEARLRERIHAIKTLCELALDESTSNREKAGEVRSILPEMVVTGSQTGMPAPKKLEMEDEANGDSLFDF